MGILIDTHALIWFLNGDSQLSSAANNELKKPKLERYISKASLWEISIKVGLGKLQLNCPLAELPNFMEINGFKLLLITYKHILAVGNLPSHHRDPFDRMLIAQALT